MTAAAAEGLWLDAAETAAADRRAACRLWTAGNDGTLAAKERNSAMRVAADAVDEALENRDEADMMAGKR